MSVQYCAKYTTSSPSAGFHCSSLTCHVRPKPCGRGLVWTSTIACGRGTAAAPYRPMSLPTEQIGSVPRPQALIDGMQAFQSGFMSKPELDALRDAAVRDTIERLEETGSPVISDGEQAKPSFATYPIQGLEHLAPEGVAIRFADGHVRQLPRLTAGPFRYKVYAVEYLTQAQRYAHVPVKQAVISASALSLLYPSDGIPGYSREAFLADLLREHEAD